MHKPSIIMTVKELEEVKEEIKRAAGKYWSRVVTPGFIESKDLSALYRQAEVFVNPSLYEGFGLPGLESLSCGTPIAVADTPVFREVYEDAAVYFEGKSVDGAVSALNRLLTDNSLREKNRVRGLELASRYTWEETAIRTLQLYSEIHGN